MKKISLIASALMLAACSAGNRDGILLRFEVEEMTASEVAVLLDRTTNYTVDLDKDGKGEILLPQQTCIYPVIGYAQEMQPIFVDAREEVIIRFNANRFREGITVSGKDGAAASYLQNLFIPEMEGFELEWAEYRKKVEKDLQNGLGLLEKRGLEQSCPDFVRIEKERLQYVYAQSYLMYPMGHAMALELEDFTPSEDYYSLLSALTVEKPELVNVDAYRSFIQFAIPALLEQDGTAFSNSLDRTMATMKYIEEHFQDENVKQNLLRMLAIDQIQNAGIRGTGAMMKYVKSYVTEPAYLEEIGQIYEESNPVAVGKKSPDFCAENKEGEKFYLRDFKGKYLFIDLWATWCGPCRQELPAMKQLEEKFAGRNITFLGLSVDQNRADWEKMVESGSLSGHQLWLGNDSGFLEKYEVNAIPRFILLDPDGMILNPRMMNPSSEDTALLLEKLENI